MVWPMFFILCYSRWLFLIRNYCRWLLARRSLTSLVTIQSWQWSLTIRWSSWKYKCDISFDHVTYNWHPIHHVTYYQHQLYYYVVFVSFSDRFFDIDRGLKSTGAQQNQTDRMAPRVRQRIAVFLSLIFEYKRSKRSKSKAQLGSPCHSSEVFLRVNKILRLAADLKVS